MNKIEVPSDGCGVCRIEDMPDRCTANAAISYGGKDGQQCTVCQTYYVDGRRFKVQRGLDRNPQEGPKMKTKQETIDYCNEQIARYAATSGNDTWGERKTGRICAYQSVIDFLEGKDETTETTVVG